MALIATGDQEKRRTRQNRCALMVAAGRLPLLLLNRGIGTGPINVPFGEQHITPATKQFLAQSTRGNPENPGKPSYPLPGSPLQQTLPAPVARPGRKDASFATSRSRGRPEHAKYGCHSAPVWSERSILQPGPSLPRSVFLQFAPSPTGRLPKIRAQPACPFTSAPSGSA